jgi:ketosteroid isomerase-like protein
MPEAQSEVCALLDGQNEAIGKKDIDRLMSFFSPDIVYFDVVPPLQFVGSAALRGRFLEWFDGFKGPISMEMRDLRILASGDSAVACRLSRARGTLQTGQEVGRWVRATSCCQRSHGRWLVTHEHISMPVDLKSGTAAMDLAPRPT